jgi:pimeloyl-ACP methyl ester carboxylesterase
MTFIDASTDGTRLDITDCGAGAPVLFSHSWALNQDMWTYQLPDLLEAGLRCVTYDRRGHGRSGRAGSGYDYDTFASDLADVIESLDLHEATLVGHSAGCGDIVRYLTRFGSERVGRIALLSPVTPLLLKTDDHPDGIDGSVFEATYAALKRDLPKWCEDNAPPFFGQTPVSAGMYDWVIRQIVDVPLYVLLNTARAFSSTDFRTELAELSVPALVVHGDLDASAPIALTGRRTAALIPDCRFEIYEGAGHGLYASEHERLNADLLRFISDGRRSAANGEVTFSGRAAGSA